MKKFTDEQLDELLQQGLSQRAAARELGVCESTIRQRLKKAEEGFKISGTTTLYNADGSIRLQWVKTKKEEQKLEAYKESFKTFAEALPKLPAVKAPAKVNNDLMAVYPLGDPHVGMLAWGEETGGDNWDLDEAERMLCEVFRRAVRSVPACDTGVIINLGDFFHYDNQDGFTAKSRNILDRDGRYAKMVQVGLRIMRRMIEEALKHHKKVKVINVVGNHDETGALFLSIALSHVYENEKRVEIDTNPGLFHFIRFGKVLVGTHHGHTCKMDKLPGVMAAKRAKDWGESEHRYWLTGHIHHDSKKEHPGCIVESFRTVAAPDAYAASGGYLSGRDTKALVYHKEFGEVERHTINIKQEKYDGT